MQVLSNAEFARLTTNQPQRLRTIAKRRAEQNPTGHLTLAEVDEYIKACTYSGDRHSANWLKSLVALAKNGKLSRMRSGAETYEDRQNYICALYNKKAIKYKLNDSVQCKDCGRYGQVVDYLPDTKEYIVVLDPFQVKVVKESELVKVG